MNSTIKFRSLVNFLIKVFCGLLQMSQHLKASVLKFGSLVKGLVKVLRGLPPDEAVHEHTIAIEEQLARVRGCSFGFLLLVSIPFLSFSCPELGSFQNH
jgi:hypothetical protein